MLYDILFMVMLGEWVVIVGYNGFGKLILAKNLNGLLVLVVGMIMVDG